jgi:hypothetical protein
VVVTLVPVGGYIAPIGQVHCRAGGDGDRGASAVAEKCNLHPWGCVGAGMVQGVLAGMLALAQGWQWRRCG